MINNFFKIPHYHKIYVYLFLFVVLALGVFLSVQDCDWTWLARFGAFLVVVAMLFEASGYSDKYVERLMPVAQEITMEIVELQVLRKPYLYGLNENHSVDQAKEVAEKELRKRIFEVKSNARSVLSSHIRKHEFFIASTGTLLWAFADLLNKVLIDAQVS